MYFQENMDLLQRVQPKLWDRIAQAMKDLDKGLVQVIASENGVKTLKSGDHYVHNKKDPILESKQIIQQVGTVGENTDVLFYGAGLGYQISAFVQQYPGISFSIYEPVPEILCEFLRYFNLAELPLHLVNDIYVETSQGDIENTCSNIVKKVRKSMLVFSLPSYEKLFPQRHRSFFCYFRKQLHERRTSITVLLSFEKRWTINSVKNLMHILTSPNVLLADKTAFKDQGAVLVSAGPALEDDIDNLRRIKEEHLAHIFSAGSAINTLVRNNIYPHAAITYDPTQENLIVSEEIRARHIKSIPLLYGSTVGYETLEHYPGQQLHALMRQDKVAAHYLKALGLESLPTVDDAATVALIALQILSKLGFNPIILVGQNLAYRGDQSYARGSTHHPTKVGPAELNNALVVTDVYGGEVASTPTFIRMRKQIENYLQRHPELRIINTTQGGAKIEGTLFHALDEVIQNQLKAGARAKEGIFPQLTDAYDLEHLIRQSITMQQSYGQVDQLLKRCYAALDNISLVKNSHDAVMINRTYRQFNENMKDFRRNKFVSAFIEPMNRVELEFLMLTVPKISALRDPELKAQAMEKEFRAYLHSCEKDLNTLKPDYEEMNAALQHFCLLGRLRIKTAEMKLLLVDYEGILTDGTIYYSASGNQIRGFKQQDVHAIKALRQMEIKTILLCPGEDSIIRGLAYRLGIEAVYRGDKNRAIATIRGKSGVPYNKMAGIFNDFEDIGVLEEMGLSFTVRDSSETFKKRVDYVLTVDSGQGAIMEVLQSFFK